MSPTDTHDYYVRADFPDSAAIVDVIRSTGYIWFNSGTPAINFANSTNAR